jgi:hypothetical protein
MDLTEEKSTRDLQLRPRRLLRDLMKPVRVKSLTITKADRYIVRGVPLTACPIERGESGRDFEVGLAGDEESSISYLVVDGRRLHPRRTEVRASKRGSTRR